MKEVISWGRQGDFYLESIDIGQLPELEKKPIQSLEKYVEPKALILGLGERTGHKHKIEDAPIPGKMFKAANMDRFFVIVDEDFSKEAETEYAGRQTLHFYNPSVHGDLPIESPQSSKVNHDEHGHIPMPADTISKKKRAYEVVRQREERRGRQVQVAD